MRNLLLLLAVTGFTCFATAAAAQDDASAGKANAVVSELTGVLHNESKAEQAIMPYLILDGSNDRCYVRGAPLAKHKPGERLYVRGILRSKLFDSTVTDWRKPGMPAPPPLAKGWVIYMDMTDARQIDQPFEKPPLPAKPATTRSAHLPYAPTSTGVRAGSQGLNCYILSDNLPNPLMLRLLNGEQEAFRYSTFMSTHATMPPMPNVQVQFTDALSRRVSSLTPVVLTDRRKDWVLEPGQAVDIPVYYRGMGALPPGEYEVSVLLFADADVKQQTPIAISPAMTVKVKNRPGGEVERQ